jgi:ATP-dependent Lhr-like helicase
VTEVSQAETLSLFHPVIAQWFADSYGEPTDIQHRAWPRIAAGEHLLVTAPTGSGKTLTAFLWALNQLLTGAWEGGRTRVLYISPLRALNNDIQRNLLAPLAELEAAFIDADEPTSPVRVLTRSGDTPQGERQKMVRRPPEILITTPETLNILLTSKGGRSLLGEIAAVVLDEIHAVAGSKRGIHLITAVDRLVRLSGEFQRVALSATVRPMERVAGFVGGYLMEPGAEGSEPSYRPRSVAVVRSAIAKQYDLEVRAAVEPTKPLAPGQTEPPSDEANLWEPLASEVRERIRANRSTLVFANSRRTTEKMTRFLNDGQAEELAYSHHGSLSREIRAVVEDRLKRGRLKGIVSTNSLELGIDIGALDEVVLIQTPPSVAAAVQRIGRAGHQVGETSRGRLYPLHERDVLDAAVVAKGVIEGDIEELSPIRGALDVLAQIILSMVAAEAWQVDKLYAQLRAGYPYRHLKRRQFDLVLEMLAGRYADSRIRELRPRLAYDRLEGTVRARPGTARLVYMSGGTIPDRGYFQLRRQDSMAKLGELDEEFVWERCIGDSFTLGAQSWRIRKITHNDVLVSPARKGAAMAPFWRAEARNRTFHLSSRIGEFLERAERHFENRDGDKELRGLLLEEHRMDAAAAERLLELLARQRAETGSALPHRHHLLVEKLGAAEGRPDREQAILHCGWGGKVLRPLALAVKAAWRNEHGWPLELEHDNDALIVALPPAFDPVALLQKVRPDNVEKLLVGELERSGFFGARFRENAGRAVLLPRAGFTRRTPLWLSRERSKKLLAAVSRYDDFPLIVETWRTCLEDEFDLESLKLLLGELEQGAIRVSECRTSAPSPFAGNLIWKQTNRLMYEDDVPEGEQGGLRGDLLRELVFSSELRPRIPAGVLDRFQRKLHRTWLGYAPQSAVELVEWVKERLLIPRDEWDELLEAVRRDATPDRDADPRQADQVTGLVEEAAERLVLIDLARDVEEDNAAAGQSVVAIETLPRLMAALALDSSDVRFASLRSAGAQTPGAQTPELVGAVLAGPAEARVRASNLDEDPLAGFAAEWLRFYGPMPREALTEALGLDDDRARDLLQTLTANESLVIDRFRAGDDASLELCDAENLERLLRLMRAAARPVFETLPIERLPHFLATWQGLATPADGVEGLQAALERLFGYSAPARLWETDLLPARLEPYYPSWLDSLLQESELVWRGCGRERLTFTFPEDVELLLRGDVSPEPREEIGPRGDSPTGGGEASAGPDPSALFPDPRGRFTLEDLARHTELPSAELSEHLWRLAWDGRVTNTAFAAVRQGILSHFRPTTGPEERWVSERRQLARRAARRHGFDRWRASRPFAGDWYRLDIAAGKPEPRDALDQEELNKDRVRLLLQRYGVLFRELLERELPALRWGHLFRTLRLMELSGEVLAGQFFDHIPGLQFASPAAFRRLEQGLPDDAIVWMSAADPASPAGLGLETLRGRYPARLPSNHLVFHGPRLVATSLRHGAELEIHVPAGHPLLGDYLEVLKHLLTRQFDPRRGLTVEAINGEQAARGPYAARLVELFEATREAGALKLRRSYRTG